jgi:uncharacterized membrane protein YeaQ/YmgE (transglycosylase-associated protein family)
MELLGWVFLGLIAGALAKFIMPGRDPGGCVVTMLLGIVGALLAGFLGRLAGFYREGQGAGFIAATFGAILILIAYRLLVRPK